MEPTKMSAQPPYKVVVAIDFSITGVGALERALTLANAHPNGEVHAVTVMEPHPAAHAREALPPDPLARLKEMSVQAITELQKMGVALHVDRVVSHLLTGSPDREIVWLAGHLDADLIVLGTHGYKGVQRMVLGSVAEHVLRAAGCPVMVVRPKQHAAELREPRIEPECQACLARREATKGAEKWCERHSEHHAHPHVNSWSESNRGAFRPWGFTT
jgi:nucleotide-binding universal stress UspA family protein